MAYVPFGSLGGLGGAPQIPAPEPNQFQQFVGAPGFGNALQALGMSLMSSPSNNPLQGFAPALQMTQAQTMQEQEAAEREEARQAAEDEKKQWAQYAQSVVPEQLKGLAATDPKGALAIMQQMQPAAPDYTADQQNFLFAQQQGYEGSFVDWVNGGGPATVINNNVGGTDEFYGQLDKNLATQTSDLINAGTNAQSNNVRLGQLEQNLANAPQGVQGVVTQFAGNLGIPVEGLDDLQAAQALINQMVPGQRPPGSGTMSDADLALFKQSLPAIINQPGGNAKIIATTKAINQYTIDQAKIAQMVANREISPAEGRALQAQIPNPLADFSTAAGSSAPVALPAGVTIRRVQ